MTRINYTIEDVDLVKACANIGYDLRCGACAELFFTGFCGHEHDSDCSTAKPSDAERLRDELAALRAKMESALDSMAQEPGPGPWVEWSEMLEEEP